MRFRAVACLAAIWWSAHAEQVTVTLLVTTDLHGNILPYDYYTAQPADRGLAKIATLVREQRKQNPNSILVDCGDIIQGTPLEYVYQHWVATGRLPLDLQFAGAPLRIDPMMLAMNAVGYDAAVAGNHDFNFGLKGQIAARKQANFPWISANIGTGPGSDAPPFSPWLIKTVAGVKVAIIGITTPKIPQWDPPEHYKGYRFESARPAVAEAVARLRQSEHPDIIVVAAHAGLGGAPRPGSALKAEVAENMVDSIAEQVSGLDAIVFGHTHQSVPGRRINGVLLMQPKNWGMSLGRMDFVLNRDEAGPWKIASKESRLIPVTPETPADPIVLQSGRPYHELAEKYLNTRIAQAPAALDARYARVEDTALIDAIQDVQLDATHADVSFASAFNPNVTVPAGPVTVRQIAALYPYENELYLIAGNGRMVREALENAARYYLSCRENCGDGHLLNGRIIGYNFDIAQGVEYAIDLTRPEGDRIRNLRWHGKPLVDDQPLRIAVNNYRAGGSGGYKMFDGAPVVWRSHEEIRDMMVRYYAEKGTLPARPDNHWHVEPPAARLALERDAIDDAARQRNLNR